MRFVTFGSNGDQQVGLLSGDQVTPLTEYLADAPKHLMGVIELWPVLQGRLQAAVSGRTSQGWPIASLMAEGQLLPPIPRPGKIVCLGLNYVEHAKEGGNEVPDYPALFLRTVNSLVAPGAPMVRPAVSERFDYEVELMVVIGTRCRNVPEAEALSKVFGYTIFNDGSVRDYQRRTTQWTPGKNFDGTGPMGPAVVTADELPPGAHGLGIRSRLNGQIMQDGNTDQMVFSVARTIAILSEVMTLDPGDVIAMGTPSGVGNARKPPVYLKPGDLLESEIDGLGTLTNPIVDARDAGGGKAD